MTKQDSNVNELNDSQPKEEQIQAIKTSEFMKETIKQRPINKRKLIRRILVTVTMAVVFGFVACFTFLILEPLINKRLNPVQEETVETISFVEETVEEETKPEDMIVDEYELQPIVVEQGPLTDEQIRQVLSRMHLDIDDYGELSNAVSLLAKDVSCGLVDVISITQDEDLFENRFSSEDIVTGAVIADNNRDMLILAYVDPLSSLDNLEVDFGDSNTYPASIVSLDKVSGLAVVAVRKAYITTQRLSKIQILPLGSSASIGLTGTPVMALGRPMGIENSMGIGYITSNSMEVNLPDSNYRYVTTDIFGSKSGSGVIVNMKGQLIGMIDMSFNPEDMGNIVSAIGITELKKVIENLSNGKEIPYVGLYGTDISEEFKKESNISEGVYITATEMDSPLLEAGIQSGDIITAVAGKDIYDFDNLIGTLVDMTPEDPVLVEVMRKGPEGYTELSMTVVLGHQ